MRQAKLVVMYSLEYYKFKFRKCLLVADKRLRSGLKTHTHIAPSCLLRLLCFLKFSLLFARVPFIYTLSALPILSVLLSSHFPSLLRAAPSPRCPFSAPSLLRAVPSSRRPFSAPTLAQPSLLSPRSSHPPHPFDSCSKENHSFSKEISERFVRKQPFKTVTCALQTARQILRNPPQKQKNADFLKFFESKSCSVQKVAVLLHSLTEKTGVPVSSERQQKFFEKIP